MKAAVAIAALCVNRWKWLPIGALLLGAFAAYAPFERSGQGIMAIALTNMTCLGVLAIFVPAVIASGEKGSGPDFLFARPVTWSTMWLGRAAACLLVGALSVVCVALPAQLAFGLHSQWLQRPPLGYAAPPFLVLGGLCSVGYASFRARQQVASVALGLCLLSGIAAMYLVARSTAYGLVKVDSGVLFVMFALLTLPVLAFSSAYLVVGRGEPVRAAVAASVAASLASLPAILVAGAANMGWL